MLQRKKPQQKPETFWPGHIFKEAVVAVLVVAGLVTVAAVFPAVHEAVARPMDTDYIPRPEWYFLFMFEALRFFPGKLEVLGAIVIPGILGLALVLLPFLDKRKVIGVKKRPLFSAIGVAALLVIVFFTARNIANAPHTLTTAADYRKLGNDTYHAQDCASCHAINGEGGEIGPDLAGLFERKTLSWVHRFIEDPLLMDPNSSMPGYNGVISHEDIEAISVYLMSLKKTDSPTAPAGTPPPAIPPSAPPPGAPPASPARSGPPTVPHPVEGRSTCLACHDTGAAGAPKPPANHSGRSNETCLSCHRTT